MDDRLSQKIEKVKFRSVLFIKTLLNFVVSYKNSYVKLFGKKPIKKIKPK